MRRAHFLGHLEHFRTDKADFEKIAVLQILLNFGNCAGGLDRGRDSAVGRKPDGIEQLESLQ
jgi:hypothetical protein